MVWSLSGNDAIIITKIITKNLFGFLTLATLFYLRTPTFIYIIHSIYTPILSQRIIYFFRSVIFTIARNIEIVVNTVDEMFA